ncbi:hypothetical protein [Paraburkholderia antibiotica]|uniref:Phage tail protein n=1 Tax=Paraburkholderia antibiotica TaxID=2728839 RepID=A0A7Y0A1Z8_9BURK|nr:hypothetical protein [Paraburkholderia antibiotica]NML34963.1 hypothetical protein [Paraburkholderia antibiotica]
MLKRLLLVVLSLIVVTAQAQFTPGQVLTAAQLNAALAAPTITGGSISGVPGSFTNLSASGTVTLPAGSVALSGLAAQAANTVLANVTASSASPAAFAMPSCSATNSALQYTSGTGFACGTSFAGLGSNTFTANQTIASNTPSIFLNDTSGTNQSAVYFQNSGSPVWSLKNASGATGSLQINRYVSGAVVDQPISISNGTGFVTMVDGAAITGGSLNNASVGATTPSTGSFTTLAASGAFTPSQTAGIVGTTTNNNANAGSIGEVISSSIATGSAVSLTSGSATNVTSISLTAGDWYVFGNVTFNVATTMNYVAGGAGTTSATLPTGYTFLTLAPGSAVTSFAGYPIPSQRLSLSASTTVYLVAQASFSGTCSAYGNIIAWRRR